MPAPSVSAPTTSSRAAPARAAARYGVALAATAGALALSLPLRGWLAPNVFLFFWVAVVVSAWYGGRGPALLVALCAVAVVPALLLAPAGAWSFSPGDALRLAGFAGVSLLVGSMRERLDRARADAEARAAELESANHLLRESHAAGRAAAAHEARLAALVASSDDAIIAKSLDGTILSWNAGAERLYGWTAAEAVGSPLSMLVPPDRPGELASLLERLARGEHITGYETVRLRRDGTRVEVMLTLSPIPGPDGEITSASTIARDVTERRRAESERRRAAERLRFLSDASRALAASLDPAATAAAVARLAVPRLADFCVVYAKEADGTARAVEVAHADPAGAALLAEMARRYPPRPGGATPTSRVLETGEPVLAAEVDPAALAAVTEDAEHLRMSRELGAVSYLMVPMEAEGVPVGALAFGSSVSGRRFDAADLELAEEVARRAATALENARLHTAEQRARRAAEEAAERTARLQAVTAALSEARTPAEVARVVIGEGLSSLRAAAGWIMQTAPGGGPLELLASQGYPPEVVERFRAMPLDGPFPLSDAVRTGTPRWLESEEERNRLYPHLTREYRGLRMGAWASVPMEVEGRVVGGIGLSFAEPRRFGAAEREFLLAVARQSAQALERARLFEAERAARAEAEAANRAKFDFLTTMSHELRTPLNAIAGYVELMEMGIRGPVTEQQMEDLGRIRRSQTHLLGLINDVLNFARIETGHVHFEIEDVPLDETLAGLEALVSPQIRAKGLRYEHHPPRHPGLTARADRDKLRQIVLNLLSNAIKFTPAGGSIWLECARAGERVEVRVGDTGTGIPADKLATIFEPFVQVGTGYTRPSEGTGLGLAISRDLARAMDGDLGVESRMGEGSVFTLVLPGGSA